ncbi:MAG: RNA-binding protein [Bdellovibrionota bacterium]
MEKKMYVGNCPFHATEQSLGQFFQSLGIEVKNVKVITDRETGRSRGFAFVEIEESQDIEEAINLVNGKEMEGRALKVSEARQQQPRPSFQGKERKFNGGGGGGPRGGGRSSSNNHRGDRDHRSNKRGHN